MKKIIITPFVLMFVFLMGFTNIGNEGKVPLNPEYGLEGAPFISGDMEEVNLLKKTVANSGGDTVIVDISGATKIAIYSGVSNNDTASWMYAVDIGVGGLWNRIQDYDTTTTTTGTKGIVGTDSKVKVYDMGSSGASTTYLGKELRYIRREKSSGNGTVPALKANDWLIKFK